MARDLVPPPNTANRARTPRPPLLASRMLEDLLVTSGVTEVASGDVSSLKRNKRDCLPAAGLFTWKIPTSHRTGSRTVGLWQRPAPDHGSPLPVVSAFPHKGQARTARVPGHTLALELTPAPPRM